MREFVILDGVLIRHKTPPPSLGAPCRRLLILVTRPFYTRSRLVRQALDMLYQRQARHVSLICGRPLRQERRGHGGVKRGKTGRVLGEKWTKTAVYEFL